MNKNAKRIAIFLVILGFSLSTALQTTEASYVTYVDIEITYYKMKCYTDGDFFSKGDIYFYTYQGTGGGYGWESAVANNFVEDQSNPPVTYLTHSAWNGYYKLSLSNVPIITTSKAWTTYIRDYDGPSNTDLLFKAILTVYRTTIRGQIEYTNVYTSNQDGNYENALIQYSWQDGPLRSGNSNVLTLKVSLNYHD